MRHGVKIQGWPGGVAAIHRAGACLPLQSRRGAAQALACHPHCESVGSASHAAVRHPNAQQQQRADGDHRSPRRPARRGLIQDGRIVHRTINLQRLARQTRRERHARSRIRRMNRDSGPTHWTGPLNIRHLPMAPHALRHAYPSDRAGRMRRRDNLTGLLPDSLRRRMATGTRTSLDRDVLVLQSG
jgi:hypothetical protein